MKFADDGADSGSDAVGVTINHLISPRSNHTSWHIEAVAIIAVLY